MICRSCSRWKVNAPAKTVDIRFVPGQRAPIVIPMRNHCRLGCSRSMVRSGCVYHARRYGASTNRMRYGEICFPVSESRLLGCRQLIHSEWIKESTSRQVGNYGYQWWAQDEGRYFAQGMGGQLIDVIPELDLVVVVKASHKVRSKPSIEITDRYIIPAVRKRLSSE